ncbi:PP2C family protein-serine/threonine phosphatase [Streptomyces sp. NPDC059850]|uniref:PP2C family protein-serine/threonine phosphatase n=1 Tax=Streptomyces sp. NPDC059850 TaxID=3346970 RepID=UPI00365B0621
MRFRHAPARPARASWSSPALLLFPLAIILTITLIDIQSPQAVRLGPFLAVAPAVTASFAGPLATGAVGMLAVVAQVIIGQLHGGLMTAHQQAQLGTLVVISVLVTAFRYVTDRRERRLSQVRSVAVAAQEVLLRPLPDRVGQLRIAAVYLAAEEEAQIGGDLYAAVRTEGATRLLIGDVRGKGLAAIGDAAVLIGAFRGSAYRDLTLPGIAAHLGNAVRWNWVHTAVEEGAAQESFVTALVVDVYDDRAVAGMVNCGHPPPLLVHRGAVRTLELGEPALPLGLDMAPRDGCVVETFGFEDEDLLVLHTDGVIEARDAEGAFFPLADRVAAWRGDSPESLAGHLRDSLLQHTGGEVGDDAAIVVAARCPLPPATGRAE